MRTHILTAAAIAMAATSLATPAFAQDSEESTSTREVLGRVLGAILGDEPKQEQEVAEAGDAVETASYMSASESLAAAIADDGRSEANIARDQYRNPADTINFFGIKPGMTVVDHFPGGAYYTEILVPYLGKEGSYIGGLATVPTSNDEQKARQRAFPDRFPELAGEALGEAGISGAPVTGINTESLPEGMDGTVDRVMIVRMMHNVHRWGLAHDQLTKFRNMLKDEGMLGIVQHRARSDAPYSYADGSKGYMRQADVVKLVEAHGFQLVGTSEVNANRYDRADYEPGVWYLPPTLAGTEESDQGERAARNAIGESDRMTLLFRKSA